jgi:hypothetical protein
MSEDPVTVDELAKKADEYLHEASLTPEEYEALKQSVAELTPIFSARVRTSSSEATGNPKSVVSSS